jgi:cytochrome P450
LFQPSNRRFAVSDQKHMKMSPWTDLSGQRQAVISSVVATVAVAVIVHQVVSRPKKLSLNTIRPPHLWSWIPYLGSAIEMGKGITSFIRSRASQLKSPVFTATILGEKCVFIADPGKYYCTTNVQSQPTVDHTTQCFFSCLYLALSCICSCVELLMCVFKPKYKKYLDTLFLQKEFMSRVVDLKEDELDEVFDPDTDRLTSQQYHHFLFKGEELERSVARVQDYFRKNLSDLTSSEENGTAWTSHEMFSMVTRTVFKATAGPLLSDHLIDNDAYEAFRAFDKGVVPLYNKLPSFLTKKAREARSLLLDLVQSKSFWDQASPLMKKRQETMLISSSAFSKANLGIIFASVGNSASAIYWALLRLMQDPPAWEACRAQVEVLVQKTNPGGNSADIQFTLDDLDELTLLESVFWESLRLYQGNFTVRKITQDFELETKTQKYLLEQGTKIMSFWGVLHSDPYVFPNPSQFQFDRFVGKQEFKFWDGTNVNYFPVVAFGGGEHLCPGRKFISYEARLYLALLMLNFDMRLAEGESIPGVDLTNQGVGVSHPEREVTVQIRTRMHAS